MEFRDPEEYINTITGLNREKTEIRRHGTAIGITYIAVLLVGIYWAKAVVFLLSKLGFSQNAFYFAISNTGVLQFAQTLLSLLMFTIPFFILFKCSGESSKEIFPLGKTEKGTCLPLVLIGIGFCAFANIANSISGQIFLNLGFPDPFQDVEYPSGILGFALTFISTAIMPPLVEEFAMRGAVMGILRKFGDGFAILTSGILFGLIHGNFEQIVFAAFIGAVLGFVTIKSGSLWTAVLVHSVNNMIFVCNHYISEKMGTEASNGIYFVILFVSLAVGIIGIYLFAKTGKDAFKLKKAELVSREKDRYLWFFTTPVIVIAIILTLYEAIFLRML